MKVHKFFGTNSREALREVKAALGPDAGVLSNTMVEGGVEITALAPDDIARLTQRGARPAPAGRTDAPPGRLAHQPGPAAPPVGAGSDAWVQKIMSEIAGLRGMFDEHFAATFGPDTSGLDPVKARLMRELCASGFSDRLARRFAQGLPAGTTPGHATRWAQAAIERNLHVAAEEEIVTAGGVYALVGPTGVGKTTTTAKLAARCVVRHGAERLALLTTDSYRVGGHEQLRIYGRILGVSVHAVRDADDLRVTLEELRGKHLVLIDTIGMSQRDRMVVEHAGLLAAGEGLVRRLLVLSATASSDNLADVALAYQAHGLAGAVITKVDEATSLGAALDVALRHQLPLHYVSSGQRVPEDLLVANRGWLARRALRSSQESLSRARAVPGAQLAAGHAA